MEKTFEKTKMHIMCNGSFSPGQYLRTQLNRAIAKVCYESPMTIEEISLTTGVPTLYLEDALEFMIYGDAIEQTGSKYATNFIITSEEQNKNMRSFLSDSIVSEITDTVLDYIKETEDKIRQIGFYGSDFALSRLMHILIPKLVYAAADKSCQTSPLLSRDRPLRKDGGNGWFIVTEGIERMDENFSGCNGYRYDTNGVLDARLSYYWIGNTFSDELSRLLAGNAGFYLNSIGTDGVCVFKNDEDAAKAITLSLCENKDSKLYPSIPIFTEKEYTSFTEWAQKCERLDSIWDKWLDALYQQYKIFTPKRLSDQIGGNVYSYCFNLSAFILKELQKRGLADIPDETSVFTKNLLMIRG